MRWLGVLLLLATQLNAASAQDATAAGKSDVFDRVISKARTLAGKSYTAPDKSGVPESLRSLDYQHYKDIRFRKDHALWLGDSLFDVEMFHLGFLYKVPVRINEVVDGKVEPVPYDPAMFDFGKNKGLTGKLGPDLGFAGFRLHYPLNSAKYRDEVIAFLGASYFRMVGRNQHYGLSARGLAVNTALSSGEEFPRFKEFWLVRPAPDATTMTFYALLDSPSVSGAYRFRLHPGKHTTLDVEAHLFTRSAIEKLGIAPLTSMFMWGENRHGFHDDFRPEVHDSDGLLMHTGAGEWIWRALTNPQSLRVSSFVDRNPKGFGLMQRDRDFDHYLDLESDYERRPSIWITPQEGFGKGVVQLVEIPANDESNDNVVAFWVPDDPVKANQALTLGYRLTTLSAGVDAEDVAKVVRTRIGWGAIPGTKDKPPRSLRQFVVDFRGGALEGLDGSQPVKPNLEMNAGKPTDMTVEPLPDSDGWRVAFKLKPDGEKPSDMRLYLTLRDERISETWSYLWDPKAIE